MLSIKNIYNYRKGVYSLSVISLLTYSYCNAQTSSIRERARDNSIKKNEFVWHKKNWIGISLSGFVLPPAKITLLDGLYKLEPKSNLKFTAGLNYTINFKSEFGIMVGLQTAITTINFYRYIPPSEMPTIPWQDDGLAIVYYKDINIRLSMPILLERRFKIKESGFWALKAGGVINYNGFNLDTGIDISVEDINGQQVGIFSGEFQNTNGYKPWLSFVAGASKNLLLRNKNILGIEVSIDVGKNGYVRGDYVITIPNKPNSYGVYKINGFSAGLTVSYTFTGANKRLVK